MQLYEYKFKTYHATELTPEELNEQSGLGWNVVSILPWSQVLPSTGEGYLRVVFFKPIPIKMRPPTTTLMKPKEKPDANGDG